MELSRRTNHRDVREKESLRRNGLMDLWDSPQPGVKKCAKCVCFVGLKADARNKRKTATKNERKRKRKEN